MAHGPLARSALSSAALVLWCANAHAGGEDLVGVSLAGSFYRIDRTTGEVIFLSTATHASAPLVVNSLARDAAGLVYAANNVPLVTRIFQLDPRSGTAFLVARLPLLDVRALAFAADGRLYAVANDFHAGAEFPDDLVRIDLAAETATHVACLGSPRLQSLAHAGGSLFSYDFTDGLIRIDPATGGVVHLPAGGGLDVQSLSFDRDGRLFGGRTILFEFDPLTGAPLSQLPLDVVNEFPDFRGMEFVTSLVETIGFETEDDSTTPLVDGQDLTPDEEFGRFLTVEGLGANLGAALFDSTPGGPNDPSQDRDLLVGSGNLLILQNSLAPWQTIPGVFDRPNDDQDGGTLVFRFSRPVEARSIDLVDIDAGPDGFVVVQLFDAAGRVRTYDVPAGWTTDILVEGPPGTGTLHLDTLRDQQGFAATASAVEAPGFDPRAVLRLEVALDSSGALDNLCFEPTRLKARLPGVPISGTGHVSR
jgi:hypothetical protein